MNILISSSSWSTHLCTAILVVFFVTNDGRHACCSSFQIPLPGGKSISYNVETGVLRIKLDKESSANNNNLYKVPPRETKPLQNVINSIEVRDTGIPQKGFGAFATSKIQKGSFLGFYEGNEIVSREKLDDIIEARRKENKGNNDDNSMDYVMSLDGGVTFIDGYGRAKDRTSFSTVHLNHADRGTTHCNCIRILDDNASAVCFFTSRVIEKDEELCFDYGANFWSGREDCKV